MLENAYQKINDSLANDLLDEVMKIKPYTFERQCIKEIVRGPDVSQS